MLIFFFFNRTERGKWGSKVNSNKLLQIFLVLAQQRQQSRLRGSERRGGRAGDTMWLPSGLEFELPEGSQETCTGGLAGNLAGWSDYCPYHLSFHPSLGGPEEPCGNCQYVSTTGVKPALCMLALSMHPPLLSLFSASLGFCLPLPSLLLSISTSVFVLFTPSLIPHTMPDPGQAFNKYFFNFILWKKSNTQNQELLCAHHPSSTIHIPTADSSWYMAETNPIL